MVRRCSHCRFRDQPLNGEKSQSVETLNEFSGRYRNAPGAGNSTVARDTWAVVRCELFDGGGGFITDRNSTATRIAADPTGRPKRAPRVL